jgi:hypothetical protein
VGLIAIIMFLSLSFESPFHQQLGKDIGLLVAYINFRDENAFPLSIWVAFGWTGANLAFELVIANGNVLGARS